MGLVAVRLRMCVLVGRASHGGAGEDVPDFVGEEGVLVAEIGGGFEDDD
jgi:hypothetical protein